MDPRPQPQPTSPDNRGNRHAARLHDVSLTFRVGAETITALDAVSHDFTSGAVTCVYGPSGSGKTTLLNVLAGLAIPDSGAVEVLDKPVNTRTASQRADLRLREVGVIFQADNLLPELTVAENVVLPLLARGMKRSRANATARSALAEVDLAELSERKPKDMSGGQRQRAGIARALAGQQRLLLADEPTGALDTRNSKALFGLFARLSASEGITVILATHDPLARDVARDVMWMSDGHLLLNDSVDM